MAVYRLRRSVGFDGGRAGCAVATTLSFASEKEEALRRFSKDGKPHRVQVVFADEARLACEIGTAIRPTYVRWRPPYPGRARR